MIHIQRLSGAQGEVGRAEVAWPCIPAVPLGYEYADFIGQARQLAREGTNQVGLGALLVRSGDTHPGVPPVLQTLVVVTGLFTVEQPVGFQPTDEMPTLRLAPL